MISFNNQFEINPNICYGDKSISHRALILASVSVGISKIHNLSLCDDVLATVDCLRTLGAKIDFEGTSVTVCPIVVAKDNVTLQCKNSGTTARLLAGLVCGLGITATFVGDESLSCRPMDRVIEPLQRLGANIQKQKDCLFVVKPSKLVGATVVAKVNSAQVKSAVLLAGMFAEGQTAYLEQVPTRNHTEVMMSSMGVDICGTTVRTSRPKATEITIPNDFSSASYLVALALLTGKNIALPNIGVSEGRRGFLDILNSAGANVQLQNQRTVCGEQVADICICNYNFTSLYGTKLDVCNAIDEIPILSVIALATKGTHRFCDVAELQHKECNRIDAILDMAKVCGQQAHFDGTNLTIHSDGNLPKHPFFHSFGDHRMAMCGAVLSLACGGGVVDSFPVEISFPNFLQALGIAPKRFCVIGNNVSQSASPLLMMCLAQKSNFCCQYDAVSLHEDITDGQLLATLNCYDGANVTIPFKRRVAQLLNCNLSSVNTVGKNIPPQSTDGYGVEMALLQNGVDIGGKQLWIVGAGGASEAVVAHLNGKCQMQVINRTQQKAQILTEKYHLSTNITQPFGVLSFVPECQFEQSLSLPQSCQFVFISAYVGESGLKSQALSRGITVVDGLQMLFHQGAKSFSLWTNTLLQMDSSFFLQKISPKL